MPLPEIARPKTPKWERAALIAVLLLAGCLRLWHLQQNGYGNAYYAAATRSMLQSWHNFGYVSFDPAGFVSVDKPPVALWLQVFSAKLFGFSGLSLLLPQALAGTVSCGLVYLLVRRDFNAAASLLAALALAITPISVAIDRTNNLDSILVLTLLLASLALMRAVESDRIGWLMGTAVLLGLAFNVKMLAAFGVLPAFAAVYWFASPLAWRQRVSRLLLATGALVLVSLSWAIGVDRTPKAQRPYVGSTADNSAMSLALGYNGLSRITGGGGQVPGAFSSTPSGSRGNISSAGTFPPFSGGSFNLSMPNGMPGSFPMPGGLPRGMGVMFGGQAGPFRLAQAGLSDQITWLFPVAFAGIALALSRLRRLPPAGVPLSRQAQQITLWNGWLAAYFVVFSFAKGIMHPYYLAALSPAVAALTGITLIALWQEYQENRWRGWLLPVTLLLTAAWQARILRDTPDYSRVLLPLLLLGGLASTLGLILSSLPETRPELWKRVAGCALGTGVAALLLAPAAWSLTPVLAPGNTLIPVAGPQLLHSNGFDLMGPMMGMNRMDMQKMAGFLRAHNHGERCLLMTADLQTAAQLIIKTGMPVVAMGGFTGSDPILTPEGLATLVRKRQVRYVLTGGMGMMFGSNAQLIRWAQTNGRSVPAQLWKSQAQNSAVLPRFMPSGNMISGGMAPDGIMGQMELYDCAPNKK